MQENHPFTSSITESTNILPKGEVNFIEQHSNWIIKVKCSWGKTWLSINIASRKTDLKSHFLPCKLKQASLLSFLTRSSAFNFYGEKSKYSELLLKSPETRHILASKRSCILLDANSLIYKGSVRKKDTKSLSNIFILIESLHNKIDNLDRVPSV